jgi:HSP20 family protein
MAVLVRRSQQPMPAPSPWRDPFRELEDLHSRTEQLMQNVLSDVGAGDGAPWAPLVDIEETEDAWVLEAEVPGAKKGDVNVDVQGSELIITGEIKERERKGILRRRTRRVGEFEFRVNLPGGVDPDNIDAKLDDGVLTVRVPKPEPARSRHVEVGSSQNGGAG